MAATVINVAIEQGVDVVREFTLPAGTDPSLYIFSSQIREQANAAFPVLAIPTVTASSTGGLDLDWALSAAQSYDLPVAGKDYTTTKKFVYDIIGTEATGRVTRFFNGLLYVSPAVTR